MSQAAVLQSGFLAVSSPDLVKTTVELSDSYAQAIKFGKAVKDSSNPYFYNQAVQRVYNEFIGNPNLVKDFDFRTRLLVVVKGLFGTSGFPNWCRMQVDSPHLTSLHKRFIADTLSSITRSVRSISIDSWNSLIDAKTATPADKAVPYDLSMLKDWSQVFPKTSTLLRYWFSNPNGVADLVMFLGIVFGERPKHVVA